MTDTSPIDLLPRLEACPLCGGEASVISLSECRHYVRCMSCPQHFRAKADAIAAWNTRPKPALGDEREPLEQWCRGCHEVRSVECYQDDCPTAKRLAALDAALLPDGGE